MKLSKFKNIKYWGLVEACPTYGLILFGVFCISFFLKRNIFISLFDALTGTDFLATSFAFLFGSIFLNPKICEILKIKIAIKMTMCGMIFILVKLFNFNVANNFFEIADFEMYADLFFYSSFSIGFVFWTLEAIYDVRNSQSNI